MLLNFTIIQIKGNVEVLQANILKQCAVVLNITSERIFRGLNVKTNARNTHRNTEQDVAKDELEPGANVHIMSENPK